MEEQKKVKICIFEIGKILFSNSLLKKHCITQEINHYDGDDEIYIRNYNSFIEIYEKYDLIIIAGTIDYFEKNYHKVNIEASNYSHNGKVIFVITDYIDNNELLLNLSSDYEKFNWNSLGSYKINNIKLDCHNKLQLGIANEMIGYTFKIYDFSDLEKFIHRKFICLNGIKSVKGLRDFLIYICEKIKKIGNGIMNVFDKLKSCIKSFFNDESSK